MGRHRGSPWAGLAFAVLCAVMGAAAAGADAPAKVFPGFAALKDSLGVVPMFADVVVVEDVLGTVEKVYLEDCRELGRKLVDRFGAAMREKGYQVESRPLLSVGQTLNPDASYHVLSTWEQHTASVEGLPASRPPLYLDSTQCADPHAGSNWGRLMRRVAAYRGSPGFPAIFPEATWLRSQVHSRYVLVVVVASTRVPQGKEFLGSMLRPNLPSLAALDPCNVDVNNGILFSQLSSTLFRMALLDCRRGEAVWADGECQPHTFSENQIEKLTRNVLKRLP